MTEEELDLLASAYVDGETTSEEVVVLRDVVQADPALAARFRAKVQALRTISAQVGDVPAPSAGLKGQQIAAALVLFDEIKPTEGQVLDLEARSRALATADSMNRARSFRGGRMPQWLPSAAVFLLIGGGLILLVANTNGGSDDSAETATAAMDESADTGSEDAAGAGSAESEESVQFTQGDADEESDTDAGVAAESSAAKEFVEEAAEDEAMEDSDADADGASDQTATTTTAVSPGGFFPEEPVLVYDEVPNLEELASDRTSRPDLLDPELSNCGRTLAADEGLTVGGFIPVEVSGTAAELFFLFEDAETEIAVLLDTETCTPIT